MSTDATDYRQQRLEREAHARLLAGALDGAATHERRALLEELRALSPHPSCCQDVIRCAQTGRCDLTTYGGPSCTH